MYVFGINLPVVEILFVLLLLFIIAFIFIIAQLGKLSRHIRVLDETTLEIRRYEEAEEVTLRAPEVDATILRPGEKRRITTLYSALTTLEKRVLRRLLAGQSLQEEKASLLATGVPEHVATRVVNNASYWLDRLSVFSSQDAKLLEQSIKTAKRE